MNPEIIGRYEIKAEIGRGGMATVYHAYDPRFEREVAIKVLPREMLHDPQFRVRFEREAKTIAMLEHPAIVPVYDFGEEDGQPYFVMRYMTGGSLTERIKQEPLSVQEMARILQRIASAVDEAHAKRIIHRDLKPGNILFDQHNEPYVSDFGIAKISESQTSVTGSAIIGTPAYMSPEQAQGEGIDGRSDIYALGVILFEALTGRQPYEGDTPMSVVVKHITEPVPHILDVKPNLPTAIELVIEKAMAKDRNERFATVEGLSSALKAVASGISPDLSTTPSTTRVKKSKLVDQPQSISTKTIRAQGHRIAKTTSEPPRKKFIVWVIPTTIVLFALAATAIYLILQGNIQFFSDFIPASLLDRSSPIASQLSDQTPGVPIPTPTKSVESPLVVGGADMIAFLSGNNIWVMNVDGGELRKLTTDGALKHDLQWTADGKSIIYVTGKCIRIANLASGDVRDITCFVTADYLDAFEISPDGTQVAISLNRELYVVPFNIEALSQARTRTHLINMKGCFIYAELGTRSARWSNDSKKIAVGIIGVDEASRAVDMIRVFDIGNCDSVNPRIVDTFPSPRFIMSGFNDNPIIPSFDWDGETLFILNSAVRNEGYGYLYTYNIETHREKSLDPIDTTCCYRDTRWSPDGSYILFAHQDINLGSKATTQFYFIPFGTIGTGVSYTPINLPSDFFSSPRERLQPIMRPTRR